MSKRKEKDDWKYLKGKFVEILMRDHSHEEKKVKKSNKVMVFKVWGKVHKITKLAIILRQWELQDKHKINVEFNSENAKILRSTILDIDYFEKIKMKLEWH